MGEATKPTTEASQGLPRSLTYVALALVALGVATCAIAARQGEPEGVYGGLLVNTVFFLGLAQGFVMWAAVLWTAQARWAAGVSRVGRSAVLFLPIGLFALLVLYIGREHWITWLHEGHRVPEKERWLNVPFFFMRNAIGLSVLTALSGLFVGMYVRVDTETAEGREVDIEAVRLRLTRLTIPLCVLYVVIHSLVAFDLIMSLDPHWFSTMFGLYYVVGNMYMGMAGIVLVATLIRDRLPRRELLGPQQYTDMANLMLGFGMLFTGLMFAQLLTIWYENLPEETSYILARVYQAPWRTVSWYLLFGCYLGPFGLLLFSSGKRNATYLSSVSLLIVASMWVERYLLVAPSLPHGGGEGLAAAGIAAAFLGAFLLLVALHLKRYPGPSPVDLGLRPAEPEVEL